MNKSEQRQPYKYMKKYQEERKATQCFDYQKGDGTHSGKMCRHPVHKCRHQKSVTKTRNLKEEVSTPVSTPNVSSYLLKTFEDQVSTPVSTPNVSVQLQKFLKGSVDTYISTKCQ